MSALTHGNPADMEPAAVREQVIEVPTRHFANDDLTQAELETRRAPGSELRVMFSGHESKMLDTVPRELTLRARLGYLELDLTGATFEPGVTNIEVQAFMGYVQIRLPGGVRVESSGRAFIGFFSLKGARASRAASVPDGRVVRITGTADFGFVESIIARC